jgi:glycosyltransferase involved in cell wall biosynthesis
MLSHRPLVSVIIPAFNAERFIGQTLDSVLQQTYDHFEIVVVDDGSTDRTAELVREYAGRDTRIQFYQQQNQGPSAARNAAIAKSTGEFVAPLDADDIWYSEKLGKQVDCMTQSGMRTGVVYAWTVHLDETGSPTGSYSARTEEGSVYLKLLCNNFLATGSVPLIRRTCLNECGGYRTEFVGLEDKELFLRIAEKYEFRVVPEFLVGYRHVRGSTSHGHSRIEKCHMRLVDEIRQRHPEIPSSVYRWARAVSYRFVASKSWRSGHFGATIRYLLKAVWNDPTMIFPLIRQKRLSLERRYSRFLGSGKAQDKLVSQIREDRKTVAPYLGAASRGSFDLAPLAVSKLRRLEALEATHLRRHHS